MQDKSPVDCFTVFCGVSLNLQQDTAVHQVWYSCVRASLIWFFKYNQQDATIMIIYF